MKLTERELKELTMQDNRTRAYKERNWQQVDGHNPMKRKIIPKEYEQFGSDWRKEMIKHSKSFLIDFITRVCKENIKLKGETYNG